LGEATGNPSGGEKVPDEFYYRVRADDRKQAINLLGLGSLILGIIGLAYTWANNASNALDTRLNNIRTECKNDIIRLENNTNARFDRCRCR
jgi:hypothetical protein